MNALAKESNVKSSLKKYFVDAFGEYVTFDISLASPDIRTQGSNVVNQWYNISFGEFGRQVLSDYQFEIFCLSRQDAEGIKLAEMADVLVALLVDSANSDGMRRIPFYDVSSIPWVQIGSMVVQEFWDNKPFALNADETKVKIYNVRLRWGTAI
jgi:hypothetical protein